MAHHPHLRGEQPGQGRDQGGQARLGSGVGHVFGEGLVDGRIQQELEATARGEAGAHRLGHQEREAEVEAPSGCQGGGCPGSEVVFLKSPRHDHGVFQGDGCIPEGRQICHHRWNQLGIVSIPVECRYSGLL